MSEALTIDQAKEVIIPFGVNKGKTVGHCIEFDESWASYVLAWAEHIEKFRYKASIDALSLVYNDKKDLAITEENTLSELSQELQEETGEG